MPEKPLLMIPGPTEVPLRVIKAMMRCSVAHYDPSFNVGVLDATLQELKKIFQTKNEVLAMPGSGRVALESSITSITEPGDRILVVNAGYFGPWMKEMVERVGGRAVEFNVEWGKTLDMLKLKEVLSDGDFKALAIVHNETSTGAVYPIDDVGRLTKEYGVLYLVDAVSSLGGVDIKTDKWNIDILMAASHKCLAAPIGLAIVSISDKAWEIMEARKKSATTFSYDLLRWKKMWIPKERGGNLIYGWRLHPITMPTHNVYALREAVKLILEEGLENRFRRHMIAARSVREGIKAIGLRLFPEETIASETLTAIRNVEGISDADLRMRMKVKYGIMISGGLGKLSGKTFRIGHMGGTASPECIIPTMYALEASLAELGYNFDLGAGVQATMKVIKEIPETISVEKMVVPPL